MLLIHFSWISLLFVAIPRPIHCWDSEELEIFDLVEEVNTNFYQLLGVEQTADSKEIRTAFRKLSLVIHPDKNDAEDAELKFRQLAAVYEVLRDPGKRKRYDDVLVNGIPDWRHAVYYYRRVRKMGMVELCIILFIIITIGQYLVGWGSYVEKRFVLEEILSVERKKLQRKHRKGKLDGDLLDMNLEIPKPSIFNTLPFQIPKLIWGTILFIPSSYHFIKLYLEEKKLRQEEEEEESEEEEVRPIPQRPKGPRRRKNFSIPEIRNGPDDPTVKTEDVILNHEEDKKEVVYGGLWTDDDLAELIKLVNKFPPGMSKRWEKVAAAINRPVSEVTLMAKKVKEGMAVKLSEPAEEPVVEEPKKVKTKGGKLGNQVDLEEKEWSQVQQKALEDALLKFPKQTSERWEKIAKAVPDKSKDECIVRYKQLCDIVKKKKETE